MATKKVKLEGEVYYPSETIMESAVLKDWEALALSAGEDLAGFWAREAEELDWFKKWDTVLDESKKPFYKWFVGGQVNIAYNCLDRHVKTWRRNKLAIIWEGENGEVRTFSYHALHREVSKFANVLKGMGVKKGD